LDAKIAPSIGISTSRVRAMCIVAEDPSEHDPPKA
jgi:hypothetical protein